jgi:hypothetical protein
MSTAGANAAGFDFDFGWVAVFMSSAMGVILRSQRAASDLRKQSAALG